VTTTLSVYKPWGQIRYAERKHEKETLTSASVAEQDRALATGLKLFFAVIGMIVAAVIIVHLAGGGMGNH